ncbi:MAG: type II toxin-antitoxin system YafQ family toxin [Proteobacteria bacterium]|nr:type II toxin-antitoxin system YafQ family toxin [Pseudomonadota bacterium]
MFTPVYTKQFAKDVKKAKKRGKNLDKFKIIAQTLLRGETLDDLHRDHKLLGNYLGRRECHLESDWLLIYKTEEDRLVFERMGRHSDLFGK